MSIKTTKIWKFFSSIKLAIWLLAVIAVLSLVGTFIPQSNIYSSLYFLFFLMLLAINLAVCLINRFSLKVRMLGSILSHASVLVILLGAVIGMFFGQKGLIKIKEGEEINSFTRSPRLSPTLQGGDRQRGSGSIQDKPRLLGRGINELTARNNREVNLGFSIRLDDFIYTEHIDPKEKLVIYSTKGENVITEIPVETGIELDIKDTGYKIKVLRYLADFVMDTSTKEAWSRSATPNNPAIEVQLTNKAGEVSTFWVFARFPDMHANSDPNFKFTYEWMPRQPKDFISKVTILKNGQEILKKDILVNKPLHFGGFTFFQSSYDTERLNWSGLQVAKDPGVGVVYAGFIMLIIGLVIVFYVNPLIK